MSDKNVQAGDAKKGHVSPMKVNEGPINDNAAGCAHADSFQEAEEHIISVRVLSLLDKMGICPCLHRDIPGRGLVLKRHTVFQKGPI